MKAYACIESTLDVTYRNRTARVWINRGPEAPDARGLAALAQEISSRLGATNDAVQREALLEWIAAQPNVNAAQVLERVSDSVYTVQYGTIAYTVAF